VDEFDTITEPLSALNSAEAAESLKELKSTEAADKASVQCLGVN
jgi:hypothetical protein